MADIFLVRHGETDWNLQGRLQGQSDIPLNATGIIQAQVFTDQFNGDHYDAVFSSDLQRAMQTAHIIASRISAPVHADPRSREVDHGEWEGMLVRDLLNNRRKEYEAFRNDPAHPRAPGGESLAEAFARISTALDAAVAQYPTNRILVVSHGLILAVLLCRLKKLPLSHSHQFKLDNCGGELIHWPPAEDIS